MANFRIAVIEDPYVLPRVVKGETVLDAADALTGISGHLSSRK